MNQEESAGLLSLLHSLDNEVANGAGVEPLTMRKLIAIVQFLVVYNTQGAAASPQPDSQAFPTGDVGELPDP